MAGANLNVIVDEILEFKNIGCFFLVSLSTRFGVWMFEVSMISLDTLAVSLMLKLDFDELGVKNGVGNLDTGEMFDVEADLTLTGEDGFGGE